MFLTHIQAQDANTINPFAYEVNVTGSSIVFVRAMPSSLFYTVDPKLPNKEKEKTSYILSKTVSPVAIEDKKAFALMRIRMQPIEIISIESTTEVTIDRLSGYEILAKGKNKTTGEEIHVYQVVLFTDKMNYYLIVGTTNDTTGSTITDFKKVSLTFKRK